MVETIVVAIQGVSYVVILIIMAVAANTMAMTARERLPEYATLKALGFKPGTVAAMIMGEALLLALIGAGIGMLLTAPVVQGLPRRDGRRVRQDAAGARRRSICRPRALPSSASSPASFPPIRAARVKIVDGLRHVA